MSENTCKHDDGCKFDPIPAFQKGTKPEVYRCECGALVDLQGERFDDEGNPVTMTAKWLNRLIDELAAPELLAACKEMFTLLEEREPEWYLMGHYNRTKAAIAKAEGSS